MAVEEALEAIARDWDALRASLTQDELVIIAQGGGPERVFDILSPHLPSEHIAWRLYDSGRSVADAGGRHRSGVVTRLAQAAQHDLDDRGGRSSRLPVPTTVNTDAVYRVRRSELERQGDVEFAASDSIADALVSAGMRSVLANGYRSFDLDDDLPDGAVGIELNGRRLLPTFQFQDPNKRLVYESFASSAEHLDPVRDPLGTLSWWLSPNAWLGTEPVTLLGTERDGEIDFALNQLTNDSW